MVETDRLIQTSVRESSVDLLWVFGIMLPVIWLLQPISIVLGGPIGLLLGVGIATWRLRTRGLAWSDSGVKSPGRPTDLAVAIVVVFVLAILLSNAATIAFQSLELDESSPDVDHLEGLGGNPSYFLFRLLLAWVTSFGEEFIFRGILISWLGRVLGGTRTSLIAAVILQACLFGYMHYETQGMIGVFSAGGSGLAFGIGFVVFKRNLWPVVIVHVALNTIAFVEIFFRA